jgi:hypothetical protein
VDSKFGMEGESRKGLLIKIHESPSITSWMNLSELVKLKMNHLLTKERWSNWFEKFWFRIFWKGCERFCALLLLHAFPQLEYVNERLTVFRYKNYFQTIEDILVISSWFVYLNFFFQTTFWFWLGFALWQYFCILFNIYRLLVIFRLRYDYFRLLNNQLKQCIHRFRSTWLSHFGFLQLAPLQTPTRFHFPPPTQVFFLLICAPWVELGMVWKFQSF